MLDCAILSFLLSLSYDPPMTHIGLLIADTLIHDSIHSLVHHLSHDPHVFLFADLSLSFIPTLHWSAEHR